MVSVAISEEGMAAPKKFNHPLIKLRNPDTGEWFWDKELTKKALNPDGSLTITLLSNRLPDFLSINPTWKSRGMTICYGNGEIAVRKVISQKTGEVETINDYPCDPRTCPDFVSRKCKYMARFYFDIPKLKEDVPSGVGSLWAYKTSSSASIENLLKGLDQIARYTESICGKKVVAFIPMKFVVRFERMRFNETSTTAQPIVSIVLDMESIGGEEEFIKLVNEIVTKYPKLPEFDINEEISSIRPYSEGVPDDVVDSEEGEEFFPETESTNVAVTVGNVLVPDDIYTLASQMPKERFEAFLEKVKGMTQKEFNASAEKIIRTIKSIVGSEDTTNHTN
jgi:hypothetical protein